MTKIEYCLLTKLFQEMIPLTIIVAATRNNGIGQGSRLPWRLPQEMAYFAKITKQAPNGYINALIMGRKTWESIPKKNRPLIDRVNIVITGNPEYILCVFSSISNAVRSGTIPSLLVVNPSKKAHRRLWNTVSIRDWFALQIIPWQKISARN